MSIYHSVKCTSEELKLFKKDIVSWCKKNGIKVYKFISLPYYNGQINLHNGKKKERLSRRRILQKDDVGYFRSKTIIEERQFISVYREEWYNPTLKKEEQEAILTFFKEKLKT